MTTQKDKKQLLILAVIVIAVIGVLYFGLFKKTPTGGPATLGVEPTPSGTVDGNNTPSATVAVPRGKVDMSFLNGKLNTQILDDDRFKALIPPSYPTVTKEELGLKNPFTKQ